jgi:hypothetical protein
MRNTYGAALGGFLNSFVWRSLNVPPFYIGSTAFVLVLASPTGGVIALQSLPGAGLLAAIGAYIVVMPASLVAAMLFGSVGQKVSRNDRRSLASNIPGPLVSIHAQYLLTDGRGR